MASQKTFHFSLAILIVHKSVSHRFKYSKFKTCLKAIETLKRRLLKAPYRLVNGEINLG